MSDIEAPWLTGDGKLVDEPVTGTGLLKTGLSALREIPEGMVKAGSGLVAWERRKAAELARAMGADEATVKAIENFALDLPAGFQEEADDKLPTPEGIEATSSAATAELPGGATINEFTQHVPENLTEEGVAAVTSFIPALATKNPQGLKGLPAFGDKLLKRVIAPATVTEGAGQVTRQVAPELEDAVRMVAGFATGVPGAVSREAATAAMKTITKSRGAMKALTQAVMRDFGGSPEAMARGKAKLAELGLEDTTLMDLGPNLEQAGSQVYSKPGTGREDIHTKLAGREDTTGERIDTGLREAGIPKVSENKVLEALHERREAGGAAQRESHPAQVAPVDLEPVVTKIDTLMATEKSPKIRAALTKVRRMLHVDKTAPDQPDVTETASETVLSARQAIGEMLYEADGSPKAGLGPKTKKTLDDLYADLNTQLDPANPTLRKADAEIEAASKEETAFKTGKEKVLSTEGNKVISPEDFDETWSQMSGGEQAATKQGISAKIDQMQGTTANEKTALKKAILGQGKWNYQKIATAFGEATAQKVAQMLAREETFQNTYRKVIKNSKTAETQVDDTHPVTRIASEAVDRAAAGGVVGGTTGAVIGGLLAPLKGGIEKAGDWLTAGKRAELGRVLANGNPQDVMDAIAAMKSSGAGTSRWSTGKGLALPVLLARKAQLEKEGQQ